MLYAGKKITDIADRLTKISLDYIYHSIKNPRKEIESAIRQLRIVREIDSKQYKLLKKQLPYFTCGIFNPPIRRIENFAYIEYFVIDIDHLSQKKLSIEKVRTEITKDPRVLLCFISPGEDGLKILFRLKERCYDYGLYSLFYKSFIRNFSELYSLEQLIDNRTSDVSRACFISYDPHVYYQPESEPIDMNAYVDIHNPSSLFDMKKEMDKIIAKSTSTQEESNPAGKDPDMETILRIKEVLKLKARSKEKPLPYVPQQLNEIIEEIKCYIEETGIEVYEIINISYGKKIKMRLGLKEAEINLFYGKRGYSVVKSPKSGTNSELNDLMHDLICTYLIQ